MDTASVALTALTACLAFGALLVAWLTLRDAKESGRSLSLAASTLTAVLDRAKELVVLTQDSASALAEVLSEARRLVEVSRTALRQGRLERELARLERITERIEEVRAASLSLPQTVREERTRAALALLTASLAAVPFEELRVTRALAGTHLTVAVNGGANCDGARRELTPEIARVLAELTRLEAAAAEAADPGEPAGKPETP